jgi:hypothetical protein
MSYPLSANAKFSGVAVGLTSIFKGVLVDVTGTEVLVTVGTKVAVIVGVAEETTGSPDVPG